MNLRERAKAFEKGNNTSVGRKTDTTTTPTSTTPPTSTTTVPLFQVNDLVLHKLANTLCTAGIVASIFIEPRPASHKYGRNALSDATKKPQRVFYAVRGGSGWPAVEERNMRFSPMFEDFQKLPVSTN
jgi:hypothetical protein